MIFLTKDLKSTMMMIDDENEMPRKTNMKNSARFFGCCLVDGG